VDYEVTDEENNIRKTFNLKQAWEDMVTHDEIMQAYGDCLVRDDHQIGNRHPRAIGPGRIRNCS
jgi:hypothetical protein